MYFSYGYLVLWNGFGVTVSLHRRRWCRWYYLDEAGLVSVECGPFVIEWAHSEQ